METDNPDDNTTQTKHTPRKGEKSEPAVNV